ncbi:unnamed protein product [Linum trigynum]|uniref:Uncharacterized protein n=1 Tax=Linum trigynum TaxID=586398 RepID=A0AAV2EMW7_9ROSI
MELLACVLQRWKILFWSHRPKCTVMTRKLSLCGLELGEGSLDSDRSLQVVWDGTGRWLCLSVESFVHIVCSHVFNQEGPTRPLVNYPLCIKP